MSAADGGERERQDLLDACIEEVGEVGYARTEVAAVIARAGRTPEVFERHFAGKDELFLAAWDSAQQQFLALAVAAFSEHEGWRDSIRAVGLASLRFVLDAPAGARVVAEGRHGDERVRERFEAMTSAIIDLVDRGRQELDDPDSLSRATAEGIAGAVYEQVTMQLSSGGLEELPKLLPNLMFLIVRPYLGIEAAAEELAREPA